MARSLRHLTAMSRAEASRPVRLAVEHGVLTLRRPFLDLGCGRGADVRWLLEQGWKAKGWDPVHSPTTRRTKTETVGLTYVVNVIEDPLERERTLRQAWELTLGVLIVSARLTDERDAAHVRPFRDGWMTTRGTFQRFYDHVELGDWIKGIVGVDPVAAAPGTYYVFRRRSEREAFQAKRYQHRVPAPGIRKSDRAYVAHRELLDQVITFFVEHGRLPVVTELDRGDELVHQFGSIAKAFRVIETVTDRAEWLHLADRRRVDLLVYLALRFLDGEYRMADLASQTQRDVRAHFGALANAQDNARKVLFGVGQLDNIGIACRSSLVGKQTPSALYVHVDALAYIPAVLKVYEGCARRIVGSIPDANIVKLHRDVKQVSYLSYPDFDEDPHPSLIRSDVVNLSDLRHSTRHYRDPDSAPILHRKELFLHGTDPRTELFAALTTAEVASGLYADPARIGIRHMWQQLLRGSRLTYEGHQLVPSRDT